MRDLPADNPTVLFVGGDANRITHLASVFTPIGVGVVAPEDLGAGFESIVDGASFAGIWLEVGEDSAALALAARARSRPRARLTPVLVLADTRFGQEVLDQLYVLGSVEIMQGPLPTSTLQAKALGFARLYDEAKQSRREADQLRMLVQGTRDYAIFMLDPRGHIMSWNSGAQHLKGYAAEEILGRHLSVFYPPEVVASGWIEHELATATDTGRFEDEGWRIRRDGSRFWANVVITALRDDQGELRGFSKVTRDLTARREAEEALRLLAEERVARNAAEDRALLIAEQRERLHVTLASIGDAVITTDEMGRVEYLNPIAERLTKWTASDAAGCPLTEVFRIVNETTRQEVPNPALRALAEGAIVGLANHTVLLARDGSEVPIDDSAAPIRNSAGTVVGSVLVFRNIAARRRTERQRNARAEATQALAAAGSALEGMRGVLAAIGGQLGWDAALVWLVDAADELWCRASWARPGTDVGVLIEASAARGFSRGRGLPGRVWTARAATWISDVSQDAGFERQAAAAAASVRAAFACPILVGDRFLGVMEFFSRQHEPVDADLLEMAATLGGTLGQFLERRRAENELREQTANAETLSRISQLLAVEPDLHRLVQVVTDEATRFCGAQFGAFFYNVVDDKGEAYTLYTLSGTPREAFSGFPMPRNTAVFGPTFRGRSVLRLDDVTLDERYGKNAPFHGMPKGHPPVRSYLAAAVVSRSGEVHGGLFFGHAEAGVFTERHEALLVSVAAQAAVAIDNARLYQGLQASAERLNLALSAADLGDWSWDAATDVVTLSPRAGEVFGIPPGPTLTWTAMQALLHPEDRERARNEVSRVIAERIQYDIEYRVERSEGRIAWVGALGRALYDDDGRVTGMYGVVADVTERKRLEQSLRDSEARFRSLMEQAPFSVQVVAPDGRTLRVNEAWEALWGVTFEDLRDYNLLHDSQLEARGALEGIRQAFAGTPAFIPAIPYDPRLTVPRLAAGDERIRWVGAVAYPIKDDAGRIVEVVLVHEDVTARRRADEALRESEEKLRLLADTIPQLAWMASPDGRVFWFNRPWYTFTGLTPEEAEGWGWQTLIDEADRAQVEARWAHSLSTGEPFDMIFPLRGRDDARRIFLTRVNPLKGEAGTILHWFGTSTDITELRETREKLAASEERLRLALEAGRMGVWDWNVTTGGLQWSDTLEPLHGLAPGQFGGTFEHFQALIHPHDRDVVAAAISEALQQRNEFYVEFRNIWPDGSLHWIAGSGKVFNDEAGAPVRMIGVGLDVTERKRSEQTARFLSTASAALADMVDFDSTLGKMAALAVPAFADWVAVDVVLPNQQLRRVAVAHVDPQKVRLAEELHERMPPDPESSTGTWHILRTGSPELVPRISDEMLARSAPDAETLALLRELGLRSYIGVPLEVRGCIRGTLTFVVAESGHTYDQADLALALELAHRTAIAIENAELYQELKDADRKKDEFLATLAHELRNPLAPIRNGLHVFRLAGIEAPAIVRAHAMMERQVEHLVRLVDDLLDVSRITRGKLELRPELLELAEVIQSATETSRPLIEQFGHSFTVGLPSSPVYLQGDRVRLAQVFANLLNNAAKYTPPGGSISLTVTIERSQAVVAVSDNGLGIPAPSLSAIFDMFAQVTRNSAHAQGGLGIGLTLVKRLIELHSGSIEVHSEGPDRGSTFVVRLPTSQNLLPAEQDENGAASKVRVRRVLVVDDNRDAATSLEMMLSLQGHIVRTAFDGPAALEVAAAFQPEIVLLDIGLPSMSGYEVCRRMRREPWGREIQIVALTGWGQEEDRRRSSAAGFNRHLVKPVEPSQLELLLALAPS